MSQINVGDSVHWTKQSKRGRVITMRRVEGAVLAVDGQTATVRLKNNKVESLPVSILRTSEQKSELSDFVELLARSARRNER